MDRTVALWGSAVFLLISDPNSDEKNGVMARAFFCNLQGYLFFLFCGNLEQHAMEGRSQGDETRGFPELRYGEGGRRQGYGSQTCSDRSFYGARTN